MVGANNNNNNLTRYRGFTIIELLIVVVVIAILAAITIVAYNGIMQRARTAQYTAAVDAAEKQLRISAVQGSFAGSSVYTTCLGSRADFPAKGKFAEDDCIVVEDGTGQKIFSYKYTQAAYDAVIAINPSLRFAGLPEATLAFPTQSGSYTYYGRGLAATIVGSAATGGDPMMALTWIAPDRSSCGRGYGALTVQLKIVNDTLSGAMTMAAAEDALGYTRGTLTTTELQNMKSMLMASQGETCSLVLQ